MSPTGRLRSMPVNQTDGTRVLARVDGELLNATVSDSLSGVLFEDARPIRAVFAWPGKRNYEGLWWSSTTRSHVEFESLLEREFLLSADFDPEVLCLAAQPLSFLWPKGVTGQRWHVPDYFLRLVDGSGRVVDVKGPDRVQRSKSQFDLTRAACREAGWDYQVFTGLPEPRRSNLAWLGGSS